MAVNSLEHQLFVYDRNLPFDAEHVEQWFIQLKTGKAKQVTELGSAIDTDLYDKWLAKSTVATRTLWGEEILKDQDQDSVVFFYSTEYSSYQQRGFAYQYSLAMETVLEHEASSIVPAIKFYSYDTHVHGFPKGIPRGNSLPEDKDGSMDGTYDIEMAALPKLFILPAKKKGMPYREYQGEATAAAFIQFIVKHAQNDLKVANKKVLNTLGSLGMTTEDDAQFYKRLAAEGFHIEKKTRSFINGGFQMQDKSEMFVPKKDQGQKTESKPEEKKPAESKPKVEDFEEL